MSRRDIWKKTTDVMAILGWIGLILLFIMGSYNACNSQCNERLQFLTDPTDGRDFTDFDLTGHIIDCDRTVKWVFDFNFHTAADAVEVFVEGESVLQTEFIGSPNNPSNQSLGAIQGFVEYTYFRNGDHSIRWRAVPPNNYQLPIGSALDGAGRIIIYGLLDNPPIVRVIHNPLELTTFEVYSHCKFEFAIVNYEEVFTCHVPLEERVYKIINNCDTIVIDSVYVGGLAPEPQRDTIVSLAIYPHDDTLFTSNDYGCRVPYRIITYKQPEDPPYVPNVFSPNGDGVNDIFELRLPNHPLLYISDKWGNIIFSERYGWDGTAKGLKMNPGVYVYRFFYDGIWYRGSITLIR